MQLHIFVLLLVLAVVYHPVAMRTIFQSENKNDQEHGNHDVKPPEIPPGYADSNEHFVDLPESYIQWMKEMKGRENGKRYIG